jgi:hypothetical protein
VLSGSQAEVSVSMLQVKNRRSSPAVVVFASADCDDDGMKVAMFHCDSVVAAVGCKTDRLSASDFWRGMMQPGGQELATRLALGNW